MLRGKYQMGFIKNILKIVTSKEERRWIITFNKATFNAMQQRYELAIDQLNELLNSDACSDHKRYCALIVLGEIYVWKKEYEKAKIYLEQALDLSLKVKKRPSELYDFLGYACFKTGDYTRALKFFRLACENADRGFLNRLYMKHLGKAEERKRILEEHEDVLPFLSAYYKQNRRKFDSPAK